MPAAVRCLGLSRALVDPETVPLPLQFAQTGHSHGGRMTMRRLTRFVNEPASLTLATCRFAPERKLW